MIFPIENFRAYRLIHFYEEYDKGNNSKFKNLWWIICSFPLWSSNSNHTYFRNIKLSHKFMSKTFKSMYFKPVFNNFLFQHFCGVSAMLEKHGQFKPKSVVQNVVPRVSRQSCDLPVEGVHVLWLRRLTILYLWGTQQVCWSWRWYLQTCRSTKETRSEQGNQWYHQYVQHVYTFTIIIF